VEPLLLFRPAESGATFVRPVARAPDAFYPKENPLMSKRELIDAIRRHNRSVAPEFLARFGETDLKAYLDRVVIVSQPASPVRINTTIDAKQELLVA
jgi:hypothetical protein